MRAIVIKRNFVRIPIMQFKEIKQLVKNLGQAVIIEENGSGLVVLPLHEYLELLDQRAAGPQANGTTGDNESNWQIAVPSNMTEQDLLTIEKLNQDIAMLKEEIKKRELEELEESPVSNGID